MTGTERAPSMTRAAAGAATIGSGPPALIVGVQNVRRTNGAFFLGDVAFLSDARFRALARRLTDADDFNSAVGAWFIALAAARRNGRPELDADAETGSRFLEDLRAVGLLVEDGFRPEPFRSWAPTSPQAVAGRARAASATRTDAGRFTSALVTLDKLVQPSLPLPSIQLPSAEGEGPGEETDDIGPVFAYIARRGAFIRPDSGLGQRLVGLVERRGKAGVLEAASRLTGQLSDRQFVLGLENALEQIPTGKEARAQDTAEDDRKRSEKVQADMYARRVELFRFTGEWDDEVGPRPVA